MTYTDKELNIIKQCNEGPFHTQVISITNKEFDELVSKLINDNSSLFPSLIAIYTDYNVNKIINYYIDKGNVDMLIGFLDYCNDFSSKINELDQKYIVDRLINKNDKVFIKELLDSNALYFLTDINEKNKLINFIS